MEEKIRQLVYLQQIDNDIQQVKVQSEETPRRLAEIDLELQAARQTYETFLNGLEEVKKTAARSGEGSGTNRPENQKKPV